GRDRRSLEEARLLADLPREPGRTHVDQLAQLPARVRAAAVSVDAGALLSTVAADTSRCRARLASRRTGSTAARSDRRDVRPVRDRMARTAAPNGRSGGCGHSA